jgi:K+-transporting ATPase ATPase C chain
VECAKFGEDYSMGQIVPIKGAVSDPAVPADAVTASGSGLDPNISPAYADLQIARVAKVRGVSADSIRQTVVDHTDGRTLGIFGEPRVNVVELNIALDQKFPMKS